MSTVISCEKSKEFANKIKQRRTDWEEFEVVGEYVNNVTRIDILHTVCGRVFSAHPNNFLVNKNKCTLCGPRRATLDERSIQALIEIASTEDTLLNLTGVKTIKSKCKLLHNKCGKVYETTLHNFTSRSKPTRCNHCSGNKKLTPEVIARRISEIDLDYCLDLQEDFSSFQNVHSPIYILHKICSSSFQRSYNNFRNGQRCPYCSQIVTSKAVREIISLLEEVGLEYKREVTFSNLVTESNNRLRIDFYIPKADLYVEYDGQQHFVYQKNGIFTKDVVETIQSRDKLKNDYFSANGLDLLRLRYDENYIERLTDELVQRLSKASI